MTKPTGFATIVASAHKDYLREGDFAFLSPLTRPEEGQPFQMVCADVLAMPGQVVAWVTLYGRGDHDEMTKLTGEAEFRSVDSWSVLAVFPWGTISHIQPEQWLRLAFTVRYP